MVQVDKYRFQKSWACPLQAPLSYSLALPALWNVCEAKNLPGLGLYSMTSVSLTLASIYLAAKLLAESLHVKESLRCQDATGTDPQPVTLLQSAGCWSCSICAVPPILQC